MRQRRAVFLDRDGVVNRVTLRDGKPHPPNTLAEMEILPGVPAAMQELAAAGLVLVLITNQPDVARGIQTRQRVEEMHRHLLATLPLRDIFVCYHDNADNCACRKPKPGMILEAAARHDLSAQSSFMVGDRWIDILAGANAGCKTLLIDMPYSESKKCRADYTVDGLPQAAAIILDLVRRDTENQS